MIYWRTLPFSFLNNLYSCQLHLLYFEVSTILALADPQRISYFLYLRKKESFLPLLFLKGIVRKRGRQLRPFFDSNFVLIEIFLPPIL